MTTALVVVRLPRVTEEAQDVIQNSFVFSNYVGGTGGGTVNQAITDFYNGDTGGDSIAQLMSQTIDRTADAVTISAYNIAGHLDGSPHGSPFEVTRMTLNASDGVGNFDEAAQICLSYHSDLTGIPEEGPTAELPTPESAIDMGAPATHLGVTRPAARHRGRLFLGPWNVHAVDQGGVATNPNVASATAISAITAAAHVLADAEFGWSVWSRRLAALNLIVGGWVDTELAIEKKRRIRDARRTSWAA